MNKVKILGLVVASVVFNATLPMISMKKGWYEDFTAYEQTLPDGRIITCAHMQETDEYLGSILLVDPKDPKSYVKKDLGEAACHEFYRMAKAHALQEKYSQGDKESALAIEGKKLRIEWYYDEEGKSQAREYYKASHSIQKDKLNNLFETLANTGMIRGENHFRSEKDGIYAFKPQPDRYLCFFDEKSKVIVTNAFEKRKDKMSEHEKLLAQKAMFDYHKRNNVKKSYSKK